MKLFRILLEVFQSNVRNPHPTLIALGISAGIAAITVGIFYMIDSSGIFGLENAEAKLKPKSIPGNFP